MIRQTEHKNGTKNKVLINWTRHEVQLFIMILILAHATINIYIFKSLCNKYGR